MVPPSPGIGFHRPMFRPYGSYGGFGSYGNPGFSSSIFSGLTSSLNNFANNYMKLGWATFGVNAGLNLLSVLFGGIQSGRTAAGRAGGAAGAGSAGRTPARDSKAILKDIQGCATLETFGSDDPESLKAEAKDEKDLRKTYLDNAKTTKIMKGSNPYTYSQLKADLANGNPEAQDVLDEVFGEKADNDPITAQELKTAIQRIKTRTTYNSKIDADQILNKLSDTSAKEAINQLDKCQEQYDAAVEAEKMAAKLGGNVTLSGKMETLRKELADSYSGISGTVDKLAQYQKEYNELSTKIGECKNNNKKERLQKKQNELAEKMKPLQKAVDEADEEIQKMRSNAGDIRIVRPQKAAPPQQPKDENSGGYTIDKDGNLCDKGGNKVDLTPDNLQKAGFELKDEAKGIWKKGDNYYKIDSGVLKPCNPDGTLITKPAENTNIPPKNSPTSPTRPTIPTTPEPPADQTVNPADDGGNTVTNKVPLTAKTGSSVVLTINGQKVSAKALGTHKGEDPNVYHVYVTNGGKVYYINEAEDGAKPRELKRDITTYDENGVKRYHINVKDNNKDDQMAKGSSMTISQYRDDGTLYTDQNYDNEESWVNIYNGKGDIVEQRMYDKSGNLNRYAKFVESSNKNRYRILYHPDGTFSYYNDSNGKVIDANDVPDDVKAKAKPDTTKTSANATAEEKNKAACNEPQGKTATIYVDGKPVTTRACGEGYFITGKGTLYKVEKGNATKQASGTHTIKYSDNTTRTITIDSDGKTTELVKRADGTNYKKITYQKDGGRITVTYNSQGSPKTREDVGAGGKLISRAQYSYWNGKRYRITTDANGNKTYQMYVGNDKWDKITQENLQKQIDKHIAK